jgi:hypothetical protein
MKRPLLAILSVFIWLSGMLFIRNEILLKDYRLNHYAELGITFPSEPINGAIWIFWSLLYAILFFILSNKYNLVQTGLLAWFSGFAMMEIVVGNMGVLPFGILIFAIPMSLIEAFVAAFLTKKFGTDRIKKSK